MKEFLKQKNNGFTLVETLVAISIFTMSILGLMSILTQSISDTGYAKKKMVASYLAQEGIEYLRNQRDTSVLYNATSPAVGWGLFKTNINTTLTGYPVSSDFPGFTRVLNADTVGFGGDEVNISSTVSWLQGSGTYSITFSENLFNWVE